MYRLNVPPLQDDNSGMMHFELDQLSENPGWVALLSAYHQEAKERAAAEEEFEGWVERRTKVEGLESEESSKAHGRLIAFGFLGMQLGSRHAGLKYQVTYAGQQYLSGLAKKAQAELAESA